ncbi:MAG: peptidylprolyl isomerase [Bacteroidia bacterium]|nr:peptidylprolyl isomerase [Bacteroidia bacterium]
MQRSLNYTLLLCLLFLLPATFYAQDKTPKPSKKDYVFKISTRLGDMYLLLYDETPAHKANFLKLAEEGFFDSTAFHRVIKNFMIQGGDPNSKPGQDNSKAGLGGPGYNVPAEFVAKYKHIKGALAAARQPDQANPKKESSGSQFYIVHDPNRCKHLDGQYTIYGQVIQGFEVIDKIAEVPVNRRGDVPIEPVYMTISVEKMSKKKITKTYNYTWPE